MLYREGETIERGYRIDSRNGCSGLSAEHGVFDNTLCASALCSRKWESQGGGSWHRSFFNAPLEDWKIVDSKSKRITNYRYAN